jgi:hypothetical protein
MNEFIRIKIINKEFKLMISTINKIGIKGKMANMCEFIIAIIFDDDFIITIKY